jgi:hypothetical protein
MHWLQKAPALLALAVALPLGYPTAVAENDVGPQTWALVPANAEGPDGRGQLDYVAQPGEHLTDHVAVRNLGEAEITLTLYAQDAVAGQGNAFEVLTPDDDALQVGDWLHLADESVTVPPRSAVVVPITLKVPADAEPGDHTGAVLASHTPSQSGDTATTQIRTGSRVYVRVAGPVRPALEASEVAGTYRGRWSPLAAGALDVETTVENTGNIRLMSSPRIEVRSLFGWWTRSEEVSTSEEVFPHATVSTATSMDGVPPLGPLWLTVSFPQVESRGQDLTDTVVATSTTTLVWAVPWSLLVPCVVLGLVGVIAVRVRRRRRPPSSQESTPGTHDTSAHGTS